MYGSRSAASAAAWDALQKLRRKIDHELISRMVDLNDRFPEFSVTKIQSFIIDRLVRSPNGEMLRGRNIVEEQGRRD